MAPILEFFQLPPICHMPIWSLEELQWCCNSTYSELPVDQVNLNYDMWGGSSRFVLCPPTKICENKHHVHETIDQSDIGKCVAAIGSANNISHLLLHIETDEQYIKFHTVATSSCFQPAC